jgi:hypothetical protein
MEKYEIRPNKISNLEKCKREFNYIIDNFDEIESSLNKINEKLKNVDSRQDLAILLKIFLDEKQSLYSNNRNRLLNSINEYKMMLKEGVDREVVFAKFFRTYPSCMPSRNFIKKSKIL